MPNLAARDMNKFYYSNYINYKCMYRDATHIYIYNISNECNYTFKHPYNSVHRLQQAVSHSHTYDHIDTVLYTLARSMKYRYPAMGWKGIHGNIYVYIRIYIIHNMSQYCMLSV